MHYVLVVPAHTGARRQTANEKQLRYYAPNRLRLASLPALWFDLDQIDQGDGGQYAGIRRSLRLKADELSSLPAVAVMVLTIILIMT